MSTDLAAAVALVEAVAEHAEARPAEVLDALVVLRRVQAELAALEPALVAAARAAGVSWQELAPALGVGSRQAAERRFLRSLPVTSSPGRQDDRVRAERDRRAGRRAVDDWANGHAVHLRRLAVQVIALTDLGVSAEADVGRLHDALGEDGVTELPRLLAEAQQHLGSHPELAGRIDEVAADTDRVRRETQSRRDGGDQPAGSSTTTGI